MQDFSQIQVLLLQWHKHHGIRSIEQIRTACSNLLGSFKTETRNPFFKIFLPLVRKGFIEFYGEGKYQIITPTILYYKKEQIAVGINLFAEQKETLAKLGELREDALGIIRLKIIRPTIISYSKEVNCNYTEPNISEILSNFPKISDVVNNFERALISSPGEYYDILKHRWGKDKNQQFGVFQLSDNSHKYYLRTKKGDLQIPDSNINPEGRPLAECFQASIENHVLMSYNKTSKTLIIRYINIPILIERVLRMASLQYQNGVKEGKDKIEYKNISFSEIKQLNRIFSTKIKIEE